MGGDGVTMIKSCGEIDIPLYRNEHKLRFRAIVAQHLHCPVIGGTTFIKDNNIKQDFVNNQITLLGNKCTVPSTQREALLPISTNTQTTQPLAKFASIYQDDPSRMTLNPTLGRKKDGF